MRTFDPMTNPRPRYTVCQYDADRGLWRARYNYVTLSERERSDVLGSYFATRAQAVAACEEHHAYFHAGRDFDIAEIVVDTAPLGVYTMTAMAV